MEASFIAAGLTGFIFLALTYKYFLYVFYRLIGRIPSGPAGFPIFGTVNIDTKRPDKTLSKWVGKYGKLFTFFLGERLVLAVGDMNMIRTLFRDDRVAGRPVGGLLPLIDIPANEGLVLSEGNEAWRDHRRFALSALRDFGFGKKGGEECIQNEASHLLDLFQEKGGKPFDPRFPVANSVSNVIAKLLFGDRFSETDSRFQTFVVSVNQNIQEVFGVAAMEVLPWLRFIPPFRQRFLAVNQRVMMAMGILKELVDDQRQTYDRNNIRHYIDAYFKMQEDGAASFTDLKLVQNLGDLYIAGFETTTTFLKWSLVYMIQYPDVQRKVQEEIDQVIGNARLPLYADKSNMPYADAVITEVFRITSFIAFGVPHKTLEDVELHGYTIPAGTDVWGLFAHCNHDEAVWENPNEFRPERFVKNGKIVQNLMDEVLPFSVGKRACLGEPLARMETFVFFTSMLQKFTFSAKPGSPPSLEPVVASIMGPQSYEMVATPRS